MNAQVTQFRKLHNIPGEILVLPNAWDAGSAAVIESIGAKAIATTSAGVAWALGYPDGNIMPQDLVLSVAKNILRVIKVPLSIDFEAGYSDIPAVVGENIKPLLDLGIAGINLEDGRDDPALTAKKVEAIRETAVKHGQDIFINLRTDVFLQSLVSEADQVKETIKRGAAFKKAGADSLFVPAIAKSKDITAVIDGIDLPLAVMAWGGLADADTLNALGVKRLTAGSGIPQIAYHKIEQLASEFLMKGKSETMNKDYMAHGTLQALFKK